MDTITFFGTVAFVIYLSLGITAFIGNHQSRVHRLFLLMSISLAVMLIAVIFARNTEYKQSALRWVKLGIFGLMPFFALSMRFSMETLLKTRRRSVLWRLIYLQPLVVAVFHFRENVLYSDLLRAGHAWVPVYNNGYIGYYFFVVSSIIMLFVTAGFLIFTFLRSDMMKARKQAKVLLITFIATLAGTMTLELFLPHFVHYNILGLSPVLFLIWYLGFYIAVTRYRLLSDTSEAIRGEMIDNVDDAVILLDRNERINIVNRRAEEVLGLPVHELQGKGISCFFVEHEKVMELVEDVQQGKYRDLSCRVTFFNENGENAVMDCRFSVAHDRFGDTIGTLMIGRLVRGSQYLRRHFSITTREAEVIEYIFEGKTKREIAEEIGVTINTLKSHIQHIYSKLSVDNKIQLIKLLEELDLVPEQAAEKKVLIVPKKR